MQASSHKPLNTLEELFSFKPSSEVWLIISRQLELSVTNESDCNSEGLARDVPGQLPVRVPWE